MYDWLVLIDRISGGSSNNLGSNKDDDIITQYDVLYEEFASSGGNTGIRVNEIADIPMIASVDELLPASSYLVRKSLDGRQPMEQIKKVPKIYSILAYLQVVAFVIEYHDRIKFLKIYSPTIDIVQGRWCEGVDCIAEDFAPGIRLYMVRLPNKSQLGGYVILTTLTSRDPHKLEFRSPCSQGRNATREVCQTGGSSSGRTSTSGGQIRRRRWQGANW